MKRFLTTNPVARGFRRVGELARSAGEKFSGLGDKRGLAFQLAIGALALGLLSIFYNTLVEYQQASDAVSKEGTPTDLSALPSVFPVVWRSIGAFLGVFALGLSLVLKTRFGGEYRNKLALAALWIAAAAALASWLPTDIIQTRLEFSGKALGGERPSVSAYLGGLFLTSVLILSIPFAAIAYFRLELMDRYTLHAFLGPFTFTLIAMVAVWIIAGITDDGALFAGMSISRVIWYYLVQMPQVIVFVMPIVMLLSGLSALSKMSKANELISMIGAGRSVSRILMPLFAIGGYAFLICLAFKYEWAPSAVGYKEAFEKAATQRLIERRTGQKSPEKLWAREGWMHVNDVSRRTWFVGFVPLRLSDELAEVVIWQLGENGDPEKVLKARRARWSMESNRPAWQFFEVTVYEYDENRIPRISSMDTLEVDNWEETPWVILSSSQNPEFLGLPGLSMYLDANSQRNPRLLAPFKTNWWNIFAEPATCLVMILVAAPLGIVYSRRGVMGGVTAAISIFAFMYVMRGTALALGHKGAVSPFWAAWSTNFVVGAIGFFLLWFRARNRDVPKLRDLVRSLSDRRRAAKPLPTSNDLATGLEA